MHELMQNILSKRDLSRAGELFFINDSEIVDDISEVLSEISTIVSQASYLDEPNAQSTIEICVNRLTSCIRETDTAEKNCSGLVHLLETLELYNHKPSRRGEDPPHAKISADIISCIFLNYNKKAVMEKALPVAVRFLNKENKEMSRNLASYLSLAAIECTNLLVPYIDIILRSLLHGNYSLARVILQLFELTNEASIITKIRSIIDVLPKCETVDKNMLLQLIANIIHSNSTSEILIIDKLPQIFDLILSASTAQHALIVLFRLAEKKPSIFHEYIGLFVLTSQKIPNTVCIVGQILAAIGRRNKEKAQIALEFIMENLPRTDRASQTTLLQEAVKLCSQYPILFNDKLTAVIRQRNLSQQNLINNNSAANNGTQKSNPQLTSGNITIVNLNSSTNALPPRASSSAVPVKAQPICVNSVTSTSILPSNGNASQLYIRRPKFDSRSTGRLHGTVSNNRSMTRLNVAQAAVNNSNLGGLHKSMTRLSSSQQINQAAFTSAEPTFIPATAPPPLSSNVIVTGENKWGIPSTKIYKITSGGVTLHHTSPNRIRPFSQGPATLLGSIGNASSSNGLSTLNQSTGSISMQNHISVHHATPLQPSASSSLTPIQEPQTSSDSPLPMSNQMVLISGPTTVTSRKSSNNKSVTLLNVNSVNHRMSVFEPSMRDTIQHFCEKHLDKIKSYMKTVLHRLPPAAKCTIEERRSKKFAKLHFACQARRISQCLYAKTFFSMKTRFPGTWIHLMFLDLQSRSENALSSYDPSVSSLKHCWETLKIENKTFITLVTSAFPPIREQDAIINELRNSGFLDVFETGPNLGNNSCSSLIEDIRWACFLCNHPEKAMFLENNTQPVIEGQLKEKKGKWRLFRRWRTRYFTLSGAHLSCKGASGDASTLDVNQIRSVKVSRGGARNIPTCFEIFTGNQTLILKPKDGEKAEEWVQYLSIVVARQRDGYANKINSLGSRREI